MAESTVITIVIPDGQDESKDATILLRRGDNAQMRRFSFSTLLDLAQVAHDLSIDVQEIEFAAEPDKPKKQQRKQPPIAPVGAPTPKQQQPAAAVFAEKQLTLF